MGYRGYWPTYLVPLSLQVGLGIFTSYKLQGLDPDAVESS